MVVTTDLDFPEPKDNNGTELVNEVNDLLKSNDEKGNFTVQTIAEKIGVGWSEINDWAKSDDVFREGLEKYKRLEEEGTLAELDNRAHATLIALLLLETKNRHKP